MNVGGGFCRRLFYFGSLVQTTTKWGKTIDILR